MAPEAAPRVAPVKAVEGIVFDDLPRRLGDHGRPFDADGLKRAWEFAQERHEGQTRKSGEPYVLHPLTVAYLLADLKFDETCVTVGLLHDVLEDTGTSRETLRSMFGPEVAELVDGVSKIGRHSYVRRDEAQAETFRKLILASAKDIRVIVVKLIDRLHNMQTLEHMKVEARRRIARETLEIYSPLAHRLGMSKVQGELEDLAFFHLYPHQFAELQTRLDEKVKLGQGATRRIRDQLVRALEDSQIDCEISYRIKRYYSIYRKLRRQKIDIAELYDYLAFRVVTETLKDSYAALGVVHQSWRPIPGRFKDYIAVPKPNLYQSLHTTVVGEQAQPFEVQIRTRKMDLVAEEGIAAHWRYKEGKLEPQDSDRNIAWLRRLLDWQKEVSDPRTFLSSLKIDLYPDEVYVFSPKGEVMAFPRGATPLDFAYRVHTDLGHHCSGARVSGRLVPLRTELSNGDIVEILTNPNREPSRDWLKIVVTPRAKSKIRHWLNTQQKQRAIEIGKSLLEREFKRYRQSLKRYSSTKEMRAYLVEEGVSSLEDLFSRVGFGKVQPKFVAQRLLPQKKLDREPDDPGRLRRAVSKILPRTTSPITVKGQDDMLAFLAKCCNPLPGDDIVGYVTRGRGVSVHASECPNVRNLLYNPEREIDVDWARRDENLYQVSLQIEAEDMQGLLARLTESISREGSNIRNIKADAGEDGEHARIEVAVQVRNRKHLEKVMRSVGTLDGISLVDRRMSPD